MGEIRLTPAQQAVVDDRGGALLVSAAELSKRLAAEPENRHLQRQTTRIYLAQISTVHAFCASILRDYAHLLDIPADFRVAEEQEAAELRQEVFDALMEQCYAALSEDNALRPLIDQFGYGRDDRRLAELLLPVYSAVRCRVDPERWMQACEAAYALPPEQKAEQTPWARI